MSPVPNTPFRLSPFLESPVQNPQRRLSSILNSPGLFAISSPPLSFSGSVAGDYGGGIHVAGNRTSLSPFPRSHTQNGNVDHTRRFTEIASHQDASSSTGAVTEVVGAHERSDLIQSGREAAIDGAAPGLLAEVESQASESPGEEDDDERQGGPAPAKKPRLASRYSDNDWNRYKSKLKELYMEQDQSLGYTMKFMSENHNFKPTQKQYKRKLLEWGWRKKITYAREWMLDRAEKRQQETGKDTVFIHGEQVLTVEKIRQSLKRTKDKKSDRVPLGAPTPEGIQCQTPRDVTPASPPPAVWRAQADLPSRGWAPARSSGGAPPFFLQSSWNDRFGNLSQVEEAVVEARLSTSRGDIATAEKKYREALAGFEVLLSPTHERTKEVGYMLANMYAMHGRTADADAVLNWMSFKHVERWGLAHSKTGGHFVNVAELLGNWGRNSEANAFLYRVYHAATDGEHLALTPAESYGARDASGEEAQRQDGGMAGETEEDPSPGQGYAGAVVPQVSGTLQAGNGSDEAMLVRLIADYEKDPAQWTLQILRSRCALIRLYTSGGDDQSPKLMEALDLAQTAATESLESSSKSSRALLETCIEIAGLLAQCDKPVEAKDIFEHIGCKAEDTFGDDNIDTINILIRIGKRYQELKNWSCAQPWFERALAAAMTRCGRQGRLTKALEQGIENQFYHGVLLTDWDVEETLIL